MRRALRISRPELVRALNFIICMFTGVYAFSQSGEEPGLSVQQEPKSGREYKARERNLFIDIPLTIAEDMLFNLAGNGFWRIWGPDSEAAYFTFDSIYANLNYRLWRFEPGQDSDTFLVNQFFHPYAGALYFASARSNNFNFYLSTLSSAFGSLTWEVMGEIDSPAPNDFINTTLGGIVLGEILHRLYIELDKGGVGGKIGASILSPADRLTAALRGYGPENSPRKINKASLAVGFSYLNARFFETNDDTLSWNAPSAFIDLNLVYDDPYTARSKTPFDQFNFDASLAVALSQFYNFTFIADGYLASWLLADDDLNQASNGATLHFDIFVTDREFMALNNGRENLSFNANSLDYTIKWRRINNGSYDFFLETHLGLIPWAVACYNGGDNKKDHNLYEFGFNFKLFLELRQKENDGTKNGHALALSLCFYDAWDIPITPGLDVNTLFFSSKIAYSLPLNKRFSLYAADSFLFLYCRPAGETRMPSIMRWYNSVQFGIKILF